MTILRLALMMFIAIVSTCVSTCVTAADTVRERRVLTVQGKSEEWLVKWAGPVGQVCSAHELTQAVTCPCSGFAYGEQGRLVVERRRPGAPVERLDVSPLFGQYDHPANAGNAALARLPRDPADPVDENGPQESLLRFKRSLRSRTPVKVMHFADVARDGMRATFLLQVGNAPCGKRQMAAIGVSRSQPYLHVFATSAHPERPLVLDDHAWQALAAAGGHAVFTAWTCGDHGSENHIEQVIDARDGRLTVRQTIFDCQKDGSRGTLLRHEDL